MSDSWSNDCPICGYQRDYGTKREADQAYARWWAEIRRVVLRALEAAEPKD